MRLHAGMKLAHYQILAPLGAGGMGEVYRARDARLDRDVAIKVLPERLANSAEALARFEREAKALAALSHPNLVAIFDVGTDHGICFAVMEFLAGETLLELPGPGRAAARRVLEIGAAVAEGLAAAHAHGVVHRDLKPANIFLTSSGQVKILDFGLARLANPEPLEATADYLTEVGQIMGTRRLHVPGAGQRRNPRRTRRHLLVGLRSLRNGDRPPAFPGDNAAEVMAAVLRDRPDRHRKSGPRLPPELKQVVARCLAKQPDDRFQSASDWPLP